MFEFMSNIREYFNDYAFEILVVLSILAIIVLSLTRIGKKGTWSNSYMYIQSNGTEYPSTPKKRGPPKYSKGELECRRVLEDIFNCSFASDTRERV